MSDTPRTDAAILHAYEVLQEDGSTRHEGPYVEPDFARELERELTRALRVVEAVRALDGHSDTALALSIAIEEWEAGR